MTPLHRRPAILGPALWLVLAGACGPRVDVGPPPEVDTSSLDPEIAQRFRERIDAVSTEPQNPRLRADLGMAYEVNGIMGAARTAYDQAARLDPNEARWRYHLACVRADTGEIEGALADVRRAIELDGEYAPAHWRMGNWLLESGRLDEAEQSYRAAVQLDPNTVAARLGMARVYIQSGRETYAVHVLQELIDSVTDHPYLHQLLGTAYRQMGRLDEARRELALVTRPQRPQFPDPWRDEMQRDKVGYAAAAQQALALVGVRQYEQAVPILERLRDQEPEDVVLLSNLGAAYLDTGRIEEGMRTLNDALALSPDHFGAHLNLSAAYERLGQLDQALQHANHAIRSNPTLGQAHVKKGLLLAKQRRFDEAIATLDTARRYDARTPTSLIRSGWLRCEIKEWSGALQNFEAAIEQDPNEFLAYLGVATASAELGDAERADGALQRASELSPNHPALPRVRERVERRRQPER
jgi:tetratricopeptide (TPR) repeat protein